MFTTDAPQLIEHANQGLAFTPTDVRWMPVSARFVVTGTSAKGTGEAQVWEMTPGELRNVGCVTRPEGIKCGTFAASFVEDRHFATGDFKGMLAILDLSRGRSSGSGSGGAGAPAALDGSVVWSVPHAHASIVNAIDGCGGLGIGGGAPELVSGGRDGAVRLWDPRLAGACRVCGVCGAWALLLRGAPLLTTPPLCSPQSPPSPSSPRLARRGESAGPWRLATPSRTTSGASPRGTTTET